MTKERADVHRCLGRNTAFPLALVSTQSNVLTVAMVHYFSFKPPLVGIGIHKDRLSCELIAAEGAYVINIPCADDTAVINACGALSGREGDKFAAAGLTPVPCDEIDSSRIAECAVNIEVSVRQQLDLGERIWFIGEALAVHEAEGWDPGQAMIYAGGCYRRVGEVVGQRP